MSEGGSHCFFCFFLFFFILLSFDPPLFFSFFFWGGGGHWRTHTVNTTLYNVVRRLFSQCCEKDVPATLPQCKMTTLQRAHNVAE